MGPKWVPNCIFDAVALRKPLGSLLERSWSLLEQKKNTWNRSWDALGAKKSQYSAQRAPVKPDQVVGPESTDVIICLRPWKHVPASV